MMKVLTLQLMLMHVDAKPSLMFDAKPRHALVTGLLQFEDSLVRLSKSSNKKHSRGNYA